MGVVLQPPLALSIPELMPDFDSESAVLCPECQLPVGDLGYAVRDTRRDEAEKQQQEEGEEAEQERSEGQARQHKGGALVHGECMAQRMLRELKAEQVRLSEEDAALKEFRRVDFDIGWKVERIPSDARLARRLGCSIAEWRERCCLQLSDDLQSVHVVPTVDPTAAINLEYLAMALRVRVLEGREPVFSLDALGGPGLESVQDAMQVKRFEPEWLAGTSVGEVLFQADYHLKELSMGDSGQPVVGLKSSFELMEAEGSKQWSAREWFLIQNADVQLSEDNVLLPRVRMGVEAREQLKGPHGLEDAPITREDHPMVKYAAAFTKNFDLIAERKSVMFHLRELAKATILAKWLAERQVRLEDAWFEALDETVASPLEVPQLWNERTFSKIQLKDGEIVGSAMRSGSMSGRVHGVYGGVEFGTGKFPALALIKPKRAPPVLAAGRQASLLAALAPMREAVTLRSLGPAPVQAAPTTLALASVPGARGATVPIRPGTALGGGLVGAMPVVASGLFQPKGVDLNLDAFSLSGDGWDDMAPGLDDAVAAMATGSGGFWAALDGVSGSGAEDRCGLGAEERQLLRELFHPCLSDRRQEAERFMLPDMRSGYLRHLKGLLGEEADVRGRRRAHFLSKQFDVEDAGPLFPGSWSSSIDIELQRRRRGTRRRAGQALEVRADRSAEAESLVKVVAPIFNKTTEEGTHYRIYRADGLEVRSLQEHGEPEVVGAIFAVVPSASRKKDVEIRRREGFADERIVQATEYVRRQTKDGDGYCYCVVLETDAGRTIVTEQPAVVADARSLPTWEEGPVDVPGDPACALPLARVLRSTDLRRRPHQPTVQTMKALWAASRAQAAASGPSAATCERSRWYAERIFVEAARG